MSDSPAPVKSFEEALSELEQLVHELEEGQVSLEQALSHYEKGVGLLKHCHAMLQETERRILALTGVDEQGQPVTEPFPATEADAENKTRSGSTNPGMRRKRTGGVDQPGDGPWFGQ
jgi:exodeoxyribonuclease VII small subunit